MPALKRKVILDTNIWVSFTIGKRLSHLSALLNSASIQVYGCQELVNEYVEVIRRPKLARFIKEQRIVDTLDLLINATSFITLVENVLVARDVKDNYLLALAKQVKAELLVTGDNDLLILKEFHKTRIITFGELVNELI